MIQLSQTEPFLTTWKAAQDDPAAHYGAVAIGPEFRSELSEVETYVILRAMREHAGCTPRCFWSIQRLERERQTRYIHSQAGTGKVNLESAVIIADECWADFMFAAAWQALISKAALEHQLWDEGLIFDEMPAEGDIDPRLAPQMEYGEWLKRTAGSRAGNGMP